MIGPAKVMGRRMMMRRTVGLILWKMSGVKISEWGPMHTESRMDLAPINTGCVRQSLRDLVQIFDRHCYWNFV